MYKIKKSHSIISFFVGAAFIFGISEISLASENIILSRINSQLDLINGMINEAEKAEIETDKKGRVRFDYITLRKDIQKIKQGINQKLLITVTEPRIIEPIDGDYIRLRAVSAHGDE